MRPHVNGIKVLQVERTLEDEDIYVNAIHPKNQSLRAY